MMSWTARPDVPAALPTVNEEEKATLAFMKGSFSAPARPDLADVRSRCTADQRLPLAQARQVQAWSRRPGAGRHLPCGQTSSGPSWAKPSAAPRRAAASRSPMAQSDSDSASTFMEEMDTEPSTPASEQQSDRSPALTPQLRARAAAAAALVAASQREPAPSQGSEAHSTGSCHPCAWYWKPMGCLKARECRYCHLCPEGELKRRRKEKVALIRMGMIEANSRSNSKKTEEPAADLHQCRVTIKNTFIHLELAAPAEGRQASDDVVLAAGLVFAARRRG